MAEGYKKEVRVGIADVAIVESPDSVITIGLGSCVGISLYDTAQKIAGLIHIMLPDSTTFKEISNPYKFADLAIPLTIENLIKKGCNKRNITAKISGGAAMFKFSQKSINSDIGERNVHAVKKALQKEGIRIVAEDVGGQKGRSMFVDSESGIVKIRIVGEGIRDL